VESNGWGGSTSREKFGYPLHPASPGFDLDPPPARALHQSRAALRSRSALAINNIDENNRARDRLIAQLRTGRLIGCTGAGVSIWAGYRSWRGVIDRLAAEVELRRNGEVNAQLIVQNHGGDLLFCAQQLGSELDEQVFAEFIRTEFGATGAGVHEVLLRIAAFPLRHALTLNFDTSYEAAHLRIGSACRTITACDRLALARFLRDMDDPGYPKHAVHVHGKFDDPVQQIALTETGYTALYRGNALFQNFVWSMAAKRLFFLGFGFTDTDFTNILRDCARDVRGNGLIHFALVGVRPEDNDNEIRTRLNNRFLLDPIFYNIIIGQDRRESHHEFVAVINGISVALDGPERLNLEGHPIVVAGQAVPINPEDEQRAEELNQRLLGRIDPGGRSV